MASERDSGRYGRRRAAAGIFRKKTLRNSRASRSSSVKSDPLPLATPGTSAVEWPCVKQRRRQHLLLQGFHPSCAGRLWFSGGPQVGRLWERTAAGADHGCRPSPGLRAKWPRRVPVAARLRLSLRRLRTDDTLRTFANGRVAQHPVDPLGIGVGVPRLLVGRATGNQEAARASGVPRLTAQRAWSMTFHSQITSRFVARAWPGGGGRAESSECLTASGNLDSGTCTGPRLLRPGQACLTGRLRSLRGSRWCSGSQGLAVLRLRLRPCLHIRELPSFLSSQVQLTDRNKGESKYSISTTAVEKSKMCETKSSPSTKRAASVR